MGRIMAGLTVEQQDRAVLRGLAEQWAEVAALPVHKETVAGWKRLNGLQRGKPMLFIYQVPWHEMDVDGELTLQCRDEFCRGIETQMRRTIYGWRHMPGDMVVEGAFACPSVIHDTGFGLEEHVDIVKTDDRSDVVSRHFHVQIRGEADLDLIKTPIVTYDADATERNYQRLEGLFGDILPVEKRGATGMGYAPWDWLVRLWGVEEALADLVERPQLAHQAMERLTAACLAGLEQRERLNLLCQNNSGITGQGGLGYTDDLPSPGYDPACVRPMDMWAGAMSQIFSCVSPAMHEEFALQYEARFLNRFGLCYYGCCEPLDLKVGVAKRNLPRLRKISMSPWVNLERGARAVGQDLVFSYKPSPAILAEDDWRPEQVRRDLRSALERTRGCFVEVILKDVSTVRYQPRRLWEWAEIARQVTAEFA
jgi:hypothetical protein